MDCSRLCKTILNLSSVPCLTITIIVLVIVVVTTVYMFFHGATAPLCQQVVDEAIKLPQNIVVNEGL